MSDYADGADPVVWIFGYGSLADPVSMARTIGRTATHGVDFFRAELQGYGRRWNYGVMHVRAQWTRDDGTDVDDGTLVALGLEPAATEVVNGVIARVAGGELANLDRRERNYDRVDVTDSVTLLEENTDIVARPIHTYVPRAEALQAYRAAREAGTAAIRRSYWGLVDDAFARLGEGDAARYRTTPPPDVPVVDVLAADDR